MSVSTQDQVGTAAPGRPSADALRGRQTRLRQAMAEAGVDAFLVTHPHNRRYLTGFTGEDAPPLDSAGMLLITPGDVILLTDSRYTIQANGETQDVRIVTRDPRQSDNLADQVRALGVRRLGFEAQHLLYSRWEDLGKALPVVELVPTRGLIDKQRTIKDADELALLRRAIAISDQAFDEVSNTIRPGMTEREVAQRIEARMLELGAEAPAFSTTVGSGPNGAKAHAGADDRRIGEGEPIVIDMGARYHGYNSDMTRTIILGHPDARFKEIYNLVLRANKAAEAAARAGLSGKVIDAAARDVIAAAGHGEHFGHGLGHGIGLEVHEPPSLSLRADDTPLDAGAVVSIEPGVYLEGWGGVRIEDLVLLGPSGAEVLTQARKHGLYE